jgi:hypothetical protein
MDDSSVDARVKTKRTRRLAFRVKDGDIFVSCTCTPGLDLVGCRHAWGAILEIDRQGALASLRAGRGPLHIARLAEPPPDPPEPPAAPARTEKRRATPAPSAKKAGARPRAKSKTETSRKRRRQTASAA